MLKHFFSYTVLFTLFIFISCNSNKNEDTYFGGKIINPKNNYVTLFSMDKVIDTLFLDEQNRFLTKLDNLKEGLYYFTHGIENQYIYLEPKDSLILHLNTWDFDESIVFAGKGAERNNFLIDCFLENEKEDRASYHFNQLEPFAFKQKSDSIISQKLNTYSTFTKYHPEETAGFKNVLKIALTYPIYARLEKYPIVYARYSDANEFPETDAQFYNYRNNITMDNDSLMYYYPYSKYVKNFLYNKTYSLGYSKMINEYSSDFTEDLLKTIDTNISAPDSKNAFLKQTVIGHFYKKSSCNVDEKAFKKYFELSSNEHDKQQIERLLNDSKYFKKDFDFGNFAVKDYTKTNLAIKNIIKNKNTVLLFWSSEYFSKNYIASRINFLTNQFPEIQFLTINFDTKTSSSVHNLDTKKQFYIDAESEANKFLTSKMPRTFLINKNGKIENGFASISSNKIFNQLKWLNKQH